MWTKERIWELVVHEGDVGGFYSILSTKISKPFAEEMFVGGDFLAAITRGEFT